MEREERMETCYWNLRGVVVRRNEVVDGGAVAVVAAGGEDNVAGQPKSQRFAVTQSPGHKVHRWSWHDDVVDDELGFALGFELGVVLELELGFELELELGVELELELGVELELELGVVPEGS